MFHTFESFGGILRPGKGGKSQPALAHRAKTGAGGTQHAAFFQQSVEPFPAILPIGALHPQIWGITAGAAGGAGQPDLLECLLHQEGIFPVDLQGLLALALPGGGKCRFRCALNGVADPIAVAAQPFLPGRVAAGCLWQHNPAAAHPGKSIGFGKRTKFDGTAFGTRYGVDAAGPLLAGEKGGVGGIDQQQTTGLYGPVYPLRHFRPGKSRAGGVIGGAKNHKARLRCLFRLREKIVFRPAGQRPYRMAGRFGTAAVGGINGIADPNRNRRFPQGKQTAQCLLTAGRNGNFLRGGGVG